jgi:hypothetical protein
MILKCIYFTILIKYFAMTLIYSPYFIILDGRCQYSINNKIIWKCDHFIELLDNPVRLMDENESIPMKNNKDFVSIGGWELNVSSTIYNLATPDEVIQGWNIFNKEMGRDVINRLFQPFFLLTVIDADHRKVDDIRTQEPRLVELLRLSYWYSRFLNINTNNTFSSKRKEIRGKLTRSILFNLEKYTANVKEDNFIGNMHEFEKMVKVDLLKVKEGKPTDKNFEKYMKELRKAMWAVISELVFAGICNDNGFTIRFDNQKNGHDYDFIVNNIPCQVKTITTEDENAKQFFEKINSKIIELQRGKLIEEKEIESEINNLVIENRKVVLKSIEQGAKIIFFNGTQTYSGFLLNQWASDNNLDLSIGTALKKSINLLQKENDHKLNCENEKYLPLIFGAAAIDHNYRFSTLIYAIQFNINDKSKLTGINRI